MLKSKFITFCREQYPTLAPHGPLEAIVVEVYNHQVVTEAKNGDVLRVMRNVGGGNSLTVRDFTMKIDHKLRKKKIHDEL